MGVEADTGVLVGNSAGTVGRAAGVGEAPGTAATSVGIAVGEDAAAVGFGAVGPEGETAGVGVAASAAGWLCSPEARVGTGTVTPSPPQPAAAAIARTSNKKSALVNTFI